MKTISKFVLAFVAMLLLASLASAQGEIRVRTNFNTRLREAPNATSLVLATIPRRTTLNAEALSIDKNWIQVTYQGETGWIATRLVDFLEPATTRAATAADPVLAGNWTITVTDEAFSCLTDAKINVVNVPDFTETVVLTPLNRFSALQITGDQFTKGEAVTMGISGTSPLRYIGEFSYVLGNSAKSAVEVTLIYVFEVINNKSMVGELANVTVKVEGVPTSFDCANGVYGVTLVKQ